MKTTDRGQIALGRLYTADTDVTIITGDARVELKKIPASSVMLTLTSPPYNIGKEYEERLSLDEYAKLLRVVIEESIRLTRVGGSMCFQVGSTFNRHGSLVLIDKIIDMIVDEVGPPHDIRLRNRIVWHFGHGLHSTRRFSGRYETILWYTKGDDYAFNLDAVRVPQKYPGKLAYKGPRSGALSGHPLGKNPSDFWTSDSDVWDIPNVKSRHVEKLDHPCQFPLDLAARLILSLTKKGDLVVDPFGGVGTTAAAAALLGRRAVSIDIEAKYSALARARVKSAWQGVVRRRPSASPMPPPRNHAISQLPAEFARARDSRINEPAR